MAPGRPCSYLAQCDRCLLSMELTGTRHNGTVRLNCGDSRLRVLGGVLIDKCGGHIDLFAMSPADKGKVKFIFQYAKRIRGRPKKIKADFEAKS